MGTGEPTAAAPALPPAFDEDIIDANAEEDDEEEDEEDVAAAAAGDVGALGVLYAGTDNAALPSKSE